MCSNLRYVFVTTSFHNYLKEFTLLLFLLMFFFPSSSSVSCFLWHQLILSLLCLFVPLLCYTSIALSPFLLQCLPTDYGVYACTLRGFWILRKFGFNELLPTVPFLCSSEFFPGFGCGVHGCKYSSVYFFLHCTNIKRLQGDLFVIVRQGYTTEFTLKSQFVTLHI